MPRKINQIPAGSIPAEFGRLDGRTRLAKQIKADLAERQALAKGLLGGLGRAPKATDIVAAENIASLQLVIRKLEARGEDALEVRRLLLQATRAFGVKPAAPTPQPKPSIAEQLAARGYGPQSPSNDKPAPEQRREETRTSEVLSGHGATA